MFDPNVIYRIKLKGWDSQYGPIERTENAFTYDNAIACAKDMVARVAANENVTRVTCTVHRTVLDASPAWQWPPAETAAPKETPNDG